MMMIKIALRIFLPVFLFDGTHTLHQSRQAAVTSSVRSYLPVTRPIVRRFVPPTLYDAFTPLPLH